MKSVKNTFRKSAVLIGTLLIGLIINAGAQSIHFEDISFEDAMAKAKQSEKIILVDVRSAGTLSELHRKVEQEIFTIDSIANFFNKQCISIRMDMNSEAGKKFAPRLNMLMYPAYIFYDAEGAQLEFTNAGTLVKNPGVLMQKARASLSEAKLKIQNTRSIAFETGNWKELLAQAKIEGKLIFLDAQTEWCRPCRMMERNIFNLNKVSDFYNSNFINVSMDMEKGMGPELVKKYGIWAYPTYLFINGDGKVVYESGGYQEADKFLQTGETALLKNTD